MLKYIFGKIFVMSPHLWVLIPAPNSSRILATVQ